MEKYNLQQQPHNRLKKDQEVFLVISLCFAAVVFVYLGFVTEAQLNPENNTFALPISSNQFSIVTHAYAANNR